MRSSLLASAIASMLRWSRFDACSIQGHKPRIAARGRRTYPIKRHRPASLDHLVDAEQKRLRHGDAKRFGSLEVDDQLEFGRLLHRQFTRASAFKYPINVSR